MADVIQCGTIWRTGLPGSQAYHTEMGAWQGLTHLLDRELAEVTGIADQALADLAEVREVVRDAARRLLDARLENRETVDMLGRRVLERDHLETKGIRDEQEIARLEHDRDVAMACIDAFVAGARFDEYQPTYTARGGWIALCELADRAEDPTSGQEPRQQEDAK